MIDWSGMHIPWPVLIDLIFPRRCFGCRRAGQYCCEDCLKQIGRVPARQVEPPAAVDVCWVAFDYHQPLFNTLWHAVKYQYLAGEARAILSCVQPPPVNGVVVPLPLHRRRLRWRGFNQAAVIADWLAARRQLIVKAGLLVRQRWTRSQVGLTEQARQRNMESAFRVPGASLPATVVLVDDVITTGATLSAAAATLKAAGVRRVEVFALATADDDN